MRVRFTQWWKRLRTDVTPVVSHPDRSSVPTLRQPENMPYSRPNPCSVHLDTSMVFRFTQPLNSQSA